MRRMIKSFFRKTKESIFDFTADPINNLGFLVPVMIGLVTFISGVVTYIKFIKTSGYVTQLDILNCRLSNTNNSDWAYHKNILESNKFANSEKVAYEYLKSLGGIIAINPKAILITYEVITAVSLITFFVLILIHKNCRQMIGYTCKSLFFAIIIVPTAFWLLQNVIPLAAGIVLIVICGIVLFLIIAMIRGDGESASSGNVSASMGHSVSTAGSTSAPKSVEKQPYQKVKKLDLNTSFWRDKGGYGILVPQADGIYYEDAQGGKTYACTVSQFEKGEVAIFNKGKRIMNIAGCKKPER